MINFILAIVTAVFGRWLKSKQDTADRTGRLEERVEEQDRVIKAVEKRHEIDTAVAREPDPVERLRQQGWSRD